MSQPSSLDIESSQKWTRQGILFGLARQPGSREIYFGSSDAGVYHADLAAETLEPTLLEGPEQHTSYVTGMALAGQGKLLVSGSYDRHLTWWDTEKRTSIRKIRAHDKWIRKVVASPDGNRIASVGDDMVCRLWSAENGTLEAELKGHEKETPHHYPSMLFTSAFSPDGRRLATADKVGKIVLWDVSTGKPEFTLEAPTMYTWDPERRRHSIGGVRSLAFSPDGSRLAAGGMGEVGNIDHLGGKARVRLFDLASRETTAEIETGEIKGLVERLAFHPEADWLLACGGDHKGFAVVIDPVAGKTLLEKKGDFHIHDFDLDPSADQFVAVGHQAISLHSISAS